MLATVTMPTLASRSRKRLEGEEGEAVEGEEGEPPRARPKASRAGGEAASPAPPRGRRCGCPGAGASAPRRSTCSSSASATRAASTRRTRHNVGWMVVDELARRHGGSWRAKFYGQLAEVRLDGHRVALLKPETYMNESGRSVAAAAQLLQGRAGRDSSSSTTRATSTSGGCRRATGGGLAGHNGLRSIAQALGTQDFLRLRIGVGRPERGDRRPLADYVLVELRAARRRRRDRRARGRRGRDARRREGSSRAQRRFN